MAREGLGGPLGAGGPRGWCDWFHVADAWYDSMNLLRKSSKAHMSRPPNNHLKPSD